MADTKDPKIEDVKEEVEANGVSGDAAGEDRSTEETSEAPTDAQDSEETPVTDESPVNEEAPSEDSSRVESADEEATDSDKVEEQIDEVEAHEVSGDTAGNDRSTVADEVNEDTTAESSSTETNDAKENTPAEGTDVEEEKTDEDSDRPEEGEQVEAETAQEETTEEAPEEEKETSKKDEKPDESKTKKDPNVPDEAKWFIVHTYAGHENKVARNLKQRVESMGFENRIFDIIVPTRETIKVSGGRKETVQEKIFPGYVIIRMILDDESWLLVRTTQGVTAFIGAGNKPTPISEQEVEAIQKFMQMDEPLYKASFSVGEAVKIVDGPFADFLGTIDDIDEARGKIKVLVSIFGRETPVELDFLQAQKL